MWNKKYSGLLSLFAESKSELKTKKLNFVRNLASCGIAHSSEIDKYGGI
tara:strand:+ start:2490 stop:2636 length:147 start_codon:yes stop_codon:yes gene_type:complete